MDGRLSKYFGTPKDSNGLPLHWGPSALPFRGHPPTMLKTDELESLPVVFDAKSQLLTLPDDQKRYDEVVDHCVNGWWQLRHEKFFPLQGDGTVKVFLAWVEPYNEAPKSKHPWGRLHDE